MMLWILLCKNNGIFVNVIIDLLLKYWARCRVFQWHEEAGPGGVCFKEKPYTSTLKIHQIYIYSDKTKIYIDKQRNHEKNYILPKVLK